jgi:hypothetical protein
MEVVGVLISVGLSLLIVVSLLMIGRGIVCWYLRINERVLLEQRRNMLLEQIAASLTRLEKQGQATALTPPPGS